MEIVHYFIFIFESALYNIILYAFFMNFFMPLNAASFIKIDLIYR